MMRIRAVVLAAMLDRATARKLVVRLAASVLKVAPSSRLYSTVNVMGSPSRSTADHCTGSASPETASPAEGERIVRMGACPLRRSSATATALLRTTARLASGRYGTSRWKLTPAPAGPSASGGSGANAV